MSYTKSTALAIKGEYSKNIDLPSQDRYMTMTKQYFQKPVVRHENDGNYNSMIKEKEANIVQDPSSMTQDNSNIYKSKIANIPTTGYSGHQSIFQKPITYLNINNVDKNKTVSSMKSEEKNELCESFRKILHLDKEAVRELPYIVGYRGFRSTVKAGNYYGKNFREISLNSKNNVIFKDE